MTNDDGGGMRDRDLTDDLLTLLDDCGRAMWLRDISDEMGETLGVVRRTVDDLIDREDVAIIKDSGADWYVKRING